MKRSPGPRKTANLSESVHQQLNAYVLAAGAAGVSLLALTQSAQAKIVYTPTHVVLPFGIYFVDFNHDGTNDLAFTKSVENLTSAVGTDLRISYSPRVRWVNHSNGGVEDLKAGFRIGGSDGFSSEGPRMAAGFFLDGHGSYIGLWANHGKGVKCRYVGVQFMIKGNMHYGWARFNVSFPHQSLRAVLTGYAYETVPNKPIIAGKTKGPNDASIEESNAALTTPTPEPPSLGVLAMGAPGLSIWRREASVASTPERN